MDSPLVSSNVNLQMRLNYGRQPSWRSSGSHSASERNSDTRTLVSSAAGRSAATISGGLSRDTLEESHMERSPA